MRVTPGRRAVVYRDAKGEWRWRVIAGNNRKVGDSGEGYKQRAYAVDAAANANPLLSVYEERNGNLVVVVDRSR